MVRILTSGSGFVLITKIRKRPVIGERKYKLCLADVHGGEMNAWRMNPKRRLRGGYSTNTLSVEFAAKSFFPISPEMKKKTDSRRPMYFGDPRRRGLPTMLPTVRFDGAAIESAAVKQTLTETKRLDTRPKYPKRCKEKYHKNLFRLSFKSDLANCGTLTKIDSTYWRQRFSTTRNVFFWSTGRAIHLGWTRAFKNYAWSTVANG